MNTLKKLMLLSGVLCTFTAFAEGANIFNKLGEKIGDVGEKLGIRRYTKTMVNIGGIIKPLNEATSCAPSSWGNNLENSCRCCLIKHTYNQPNLTAALGSKAYQFCQSKKYCTPQSIQGIQTKEEIKDPLSLIKVIQQENLEIPEIPMDQKMLTVTHGDLDPKTAGIFLKKAVEAGFITKNSKAFVNPDKCLEIKKLGSGGYQTLQLFGIKIKKECQQEKENPNKYFQYILKESKKQVGELGSLIKLRNSPLVQFDVDNPNRPKEAIALAFDSKNLTYTYKGKKRYMSLLAGAPGTSFFNYIQDFAKKYAAPQGPSKNDIVSFQDMMRKLGFSLSNFHQKKINGRTPVHGDLHVQNIFIDDKTGTFTVIDNETMRNSMKRTVSPDIDLWVLYGFSVLWKSKDFGIPKEIPLAAWHEYMFIPLIEGYISAFPPEEQQAEYIRLRKVFLHKGNKTFWQERKMLMNLTTLNNLQQKYIRPAFDKIQRDLFSR